MPPRSDPFNVGDEVELESDVYVNDALADATTMRCFVTKPRTGTVLELTVTRPLTNPTGRYLAILAPADHDEPGVWRYRFDSTGPVQSERDHFTSYPA